MDVKRVTVQEVKQKMHRGESITFIDTRNPQAWASSSVRLPGAIRVPADAVEAHIKEIPQGRTLVTYCT